MSDQGSSTEKLAAAILRDRDQGTDEAESTSERREHGADLGRCYSCGAGMVYHAFTDDKSGRFCSDHCREWFDAGNPPWWENPGFRPALMGDALYSTPGWKVVAGPPGIEIGSRYYTPPLGQTGATIVCGGCGKPFVSKGLRCHSPDCERRYREREDNQSAMAEVGMELVVTKRVCERPGCGRPIPNWRKGRRVSKSVRYCSTGCQQKHRKALRAADGY
jgi:hypothetical protein